MSSKYKRIHRDSGFSSTEHDTKPFSAVVFIKNLLQKDLNEDISVRDYAYDVNKDCLMLELSVPIEVDIRSLMAVISTKASFPVNSCHVTRKLGILSLTCQNVSLYWNDLIEWEFEKKNQGSLVCGMSPTTFLFFLLSLILFCAVIYYRSYGIIENNNEQFEQCKTFIPPNSGTYFFYSDNLVIQEKNSEP
jgi:hypothetical protein